MTPSQWVHGLATTAHNAKIATDDATRPPPPESYQVRATIPQGRYEQTIHLTGPEMVNALRSGWTLWDAFSPGWEWVLTRNGLLCQVDRKAEALAFYKQERYVHI